MWANVQFSSPIAESQHSVDKSRKQHQKHIIQKHVSKLLAKKVKQVERDSLQRRAGVKRSVRGVLVFVLQYLSQDTLWWNIRILLAANNRSFQMNYIRNLLPHISSEVEHFQGCLLARRQILSILLLCQSLSCQPQVPKIAIIHQRSHPHSTMSSGKESVSL